jgi:hypothetical protein
MLIERGLLPDREVGLVEIDRAVSAYLFEAAGDTNFTRVKTILRARWNPTQPAIADRNGNRRNNEDWFGPKDESSGAVGNRTTPVREWLKRKEAATA